MSAYMVGVDHIDFLVTRMIGPGRLDDRTAVYLPAMTPLAEAGLGWDRVSQYVQHSRWSSMMRVDHDNATAVGLALWEENLRSVSYRYPDVGDPDQTDGIPGPNDLLVDVARYQWRATGRDLPAIHVIAAIHGFRYQSCEHPGWETSFAKAAVDALEQQMIRKVPGYDEGPWHYHRPVEPEPVSLSDVMRSPR